MSCGEYVAHVQGDWLECHEVYDIDINKHEFILKDFVCLCKKCHLYIQQGYLRILLSEGKINKEYYDEVIQHGNKLLGENNLIKAELPSEEINNPDWYLLYKGEKYSNVNEE